MSAHATARRRTGLAILLLCFTAYLVSADMQLRSIDEVASYVVTRSLIGQRSIWGDALFWLHDQMGHGAVTAPGLDGHQYVIKDIGPSLLAVPLAWLGRQIGSGPVPAAMLLMPLLTAISAALIYTFSEQRYGQLPALLATLGFGLGSLAWPYAGTFFTQPAAALGLLLALIGSINARQRESWKWALLGGAGLGLAGLSALPTYVTGPLYVLYLFPWERWRQNGVGQALQQSFPLLLAFGGSVVLCISIQAGYNMLRFGSPLETGHAINNALSGHTSVLFSLRYLPAGLFGQLFSLPKGLLWYAPFTLMAVPGFFQSLRGEDRREGLLIGGQAALITLLYSLYVFWNGGVAWGPRHLTDIMPALALLSVFSLARLFPHEGGRIDLRWKQAAVLGLLALSIATQAFASSIYDHTLEAARYEVSDPTVEPEMTLAGLLSFDLAPQATWFNGFISPVWTVYWIRDERIDGPGLVLGMSLLAINAVALWLVWRKNHSSIALMGQLAGALLLSAVLINRPPPPIEPGDPFGELVRMTEAVVAPEDIVLTLLPDTYLSWLVAYTGPARDIGLANDILLTDSPGVPPGTPGGDESLVWLVTDGPPDTSNVEGWLSESAYRGSELWFDAHYRLIPFHFADTPTNVHKVAADFGNGEAQLAEAGYSVSVRGLDVYCLWATNEWEEGDINTFLHLIGPDGMLAAQIDGPLLLESAGTVEQRLYLLLPETLPAGEYTLFTGLYHWQTGVRIPLANGSGDRVSLGSVMLPGG